MVSFLLIVVVPLAVLIVVATYVYRRPKSLPQQDLDGRAIDMHGQVGDPIGEMGAANWGGGGMGGGG